MTKKQQIQEVLNNHPELRGKLYERGFVFTNADVNEKIYPFYGLWQTRKIGAYNLLVSEQQRYYVVENSDKIFVLIGHAYNPFKMQCDENDILHSLAEKEFASDAFWSDINELTGVFTVIILIGERAFIFGDASCMQTTFYNEKGNIVCVSSHANLIGDILNAERDEYVNRLSHYRFFKLLGNALPGNLTQFKDVKRLMPNHYAEFVGGRVKIYRFYYPQKIVCDIAEVIDLSAEILHKNLQLITKKWKKPAISMTGGCDSKTTLACANGLYENFLYFSYSSSESEEVDAQAAHKICKELGLEHKIYNIPDEDDKIPLIESVRLILERNTGDIIPNNKNDVRKRAYFATKNDFDIEVKSWASEIGRAYFSKRFNGRKNFGKKPTPRKCTTLYKFFLNNRKLVRQTDKVFAEYLEKYFDRKSENPIEWQEQFFWEFRVASWNGLVITGEHRYSFDITIPYNNRKLLELLLSVPIQYRIDDLIHREIRKKMNPSIDETGISVTNLKHTKLRSRLENIYYTIHSKLMF